MAALPQEPLAAAAATMMPVRTVPVLPPESSVEWEPQQEGAQATEAPTRAWPPVPVAPPPEELALGGGSQLASLARGVEMHVQQLNAACVERWGYPAGVDSEQILREVASFRQAMQERLSQLRPEQDASAGTVHEALRQSLSSAQRRCASLNEDMLRVADANEELMSSMQTVKATNRRLADQLQTQGDEIAQLTKLRLVDEERIDELSQRNREECLRWRADLEERIRSSEAEVAALYQDRRASLVAKLQEVRRGLRLLTPRLQGLRRLQAAAASEARAGLAEWRSDVFERIAGRLAERFASQRRADEGRLLQLDDEIHAKSAKLAFEREARQREANAHRQRESELAAEGRELAGRAEGELARLRAELTAAETLREAEARGAEQDRQAVCRRLRELVTSTASLDVQLESLRGTALALEEQRVRKEAERQRLDEELHAAKQRLQRSDEALEKAVANNEELRRQMEAQRAQAHASRSRAIGDCSQQAEAELAGLVTNQRRESLALAERMQGLEQELAARAAEAARLQLTTESKGAERAALQRECALWRAQEELAASLRAEVERDFTEAKEEWDRQLQQLQAQSTALTDRQLAMEDELRSSQGAANDFRRSAGQQAAKTQAEATALEAKVQEANEALGTTKRALQEKVSMLAAVRSEAGSLRAKAALARDDLERQLMQLAEDGRRARERLLTEAGAERQRAQRAELECEELRRVGQTAFEEAQTEPRAQVATMERELQDLRDKHNAEKCQLGMTFETNRKQLDSMEVDLTRMKDLLEEAERQLQAETAALQTAREARKMREEELEKDLASERERLAASWARQGRRAATAAACGEEQARQRKEVERLAAECEQEAREGEMELENLRKQCAGVLAARKDVMRDELERQSQVLEAAELENRRLRRSVAGMRSSSPTGAAGAAAVAAAGASASGGFAAVGSTHGVAAGHDVAAGAVGATTTGEPKARYSIEDSRWDVQDSIGRMQWHTDRLRRELHQQQRPGGALAW
uniref:Uncharacterized protein n=1 Tax=Alexandrium monilatum TaxID=311494 RepID=A0A7S4QUI8_9DINO